MPDSVKVVVSPARKLIGRELLIKFEPRHLEDSQLLFSWRFATLGYNPN
jgi:hypothetical protein